MCRIERGIARYAPLCIYVFRLVAPRRLLEAQIFNQRYHSYAEIQNVPDRMRWCRYHMGLMQKEVAALVGISEGVYMGLEKARNEYYEKDVVDKLAALFHIPVQDLLDEYNAFMYNDPAKKIREYRMSLGLGTERFARKIGTSDTCVRSWENNTKLISRKSWERCFKGKIK